MSIQISQSPALSSTPGPLFRTTGPSGAVATSPQIVTWATTTFDTFSGFSSGTTYTIPVGWTGYYQIYAEMLWNVSAPSGSAFTKIYIYQNGSAISQMDWGVTTGQIISAMSASDLLMCSAGDTIEIYTSESNLTSGSFATEGTQVFTIQYVTS
jgi:hypothetical protein